MLIAHKIALDPNNVQATCFARAAGTARFAYNAVGDRQAADLGKYRQQWEKLEGREPQRQQEQTKAKKIKRDSSQDLSR